MMAHFEETLFQDLANIIGQGKRRAIAQVNSVLTLTYWQVGKRINEHVLQNNRATYGKEIVVSLSKQLENAFGRSYTARNLRRMMQFAEELSWLTNCDTTGDTIDMESFHRTFATGNTRKKALLFINIGKFFL